ncbi:MAG TPA: hypothetical protein VJT73_05930 [Polyangiaceae bacterium]|nr:hypothetical protein [Polyangiaceae bacterium]
MADRGIALIILAANTLACGGSGTQSGNAGAAPTRHLCEGSSAIRLAISYLVPGDQVFGAVNVELGQPYIYVDGNCRYWVRTWEEDRFARWRAIHTGVLDETDEKSLADSIQYDDLPSLVRTCTSSGASDGGFIGLFDGEHALGCPNGAPELKANEAIWLRLGQKLYAASQPVVGDLRVEIGIGFGPVSSVAPYEWPLATPIEKLLISDDQRFTRGVSKRLSGESEVAKLLDLRERYFRDQASQLPWEPGIEIKGNQADTYVLYFREHLPFTGDNGLPAFLNLP